MTNADLVKDGFYPHHRCILCGIAVGYIVKNSVAYFDSSCGCSPYSSEPERRSMDELRAFLYWRKSNG